MLCDKVYNPFSRTSRLSSGISWSCVSELASSAFRRLRQVKTGISESGMNLNIDRSLSANPSSRCLSQEQRQVVRSKVRKRLCPIDRHKEAVRSKRSLRRLEALRQSILKHAFSGRSSHKTRTMNPPSVLLERIRAERNAAACTKPTKQERQEGGRMSTAPIVSKGLELLQHAARRRRRLWRLSGAAHLSDLPQDGG